VSAAAPPERSDPSRGPFTETDKAGVVLIDDHSVMRQGLAALINAEPGLYVAGEAEDLHEAMEVIAATRPRVALIDISLKGGGNGLELIKQICAHQPDVLPLVLSMHDEAVYAERALHAGARGYIRKVEAADKVMAAIRRVLEGKVYVSESVAANLLNRVGGKTSRTGSSVDRLSDRELQVLRCIGRGMSSREIGDELFISVKTVEAHREHIKQKLSLPSSAELLRYAIEFCRVEG
jgi:DNA-binding NarL/FixJ family response regulator